MNISVYVCFLAIESKAYFDPNEVNQGESSKLTIALSRYVTKIDVWLVNKETGAQRSCTFYNGYTFSLDFDDVTTSDSGDWEIKISTTEGNTYTHARLTVKVGTGKFHLVVITSAVLLYLCYTFSW